MDIDLAKSYSYPICGMELGTHTKILAPVHKAILLDEHLEACAIFTVIKRHLRS